MKVIVGLGNPGQKYLFTRHNVGFILLDLMAVETGSDFQSTKMQGLALKTNLFSEPALLVKPQTFMNVSGACVSKVLNFYKLSPKDLIVLHDDIDMEHGKVKMKASGGHGGHNGIRNIIQALGTKDFWRIKIGVGRPASKNDGPESGVSNWVLGPFAKPELEDLKNQVYDDVMLRINEVLT